MYDLPPRLDYDTFTCTILSMSPVHPLGSGVEMRVILESEDLSSRPCFYACGLHRLEWAVQCLGASLASQPSG